MSYGGASVTLAIAAIVTVSRGSRSRRRIAASLSGGLVRTIFNRSSWNFFHEPLPTVSSPDGLLSIHATTSLSETEIASAVHPIGLKSHGAKTSAEATSHGDHVVRPCTVPSLWKAQYSVSRIAISIPE